MKEIILECAQVYSEKREFYELKLSVLLRKICLVLLEECKTLIKRNTRHYAKRQMNWFRHQGHFQWIEPIFQNIINHSSL